MTASGAGSGESRLLGIIRLLRRIPRPIIARDQAVAIAEAEFVRRGWVRETDAPIIERLRCWEVWARDARPCANLILRIDMHTGALQ